jgi:hypothetical protein
MEIIRLPQPGGCACGRLRYHLTGPPLLAYACHCRVCQARTGSAFALSVMVHSADVVLSGDAPEIRRSTTSWGRPVDHSFCPECRTRLFGRPVATPDVANLRAGTLDDPTWVRPVAQTWVESAIPWAVIPGVRQVAPEAFDLVELSREWRASAPWFEEDSRSIRVPGYGAADAPFASPAGAGADGERYLPR